MSPEPNEAKYSDDEIEQVLGTGLSDAKLTLREIEETISENPFLVTGLVFALGILIGVGLGCHGKSRS